METLFLVIYIVGVIVAFIIDFAKFYKEEQLVNDVGNIKIKK